MATPCALPTWRRASLRFVAAAVLLLALPAAAQQSTVAAVFYSQTNEPAGNSIVVTTVSTTGTLSYLTSVSTGGVGVGGTAVADALFSQDAVKVGDNYLFAVNAGSNTLSTFSITNFGLTLTLLNTAATQGTFPVSVAYSSKLKVACVLNGGVTNGVACFTVSATGATFASKVLLSVSGLSDTPTGAAGTLSDIVFDPASAQVLVSLKGTPTTPGTLYVIPVGAGGMLGAAVANTVSPSRVFFSLTNIVGSSAWGFSDAAFGYGTFTLSGTSVTGAAAVPLVSNHANCWTAWAPQSGRLLVIDGAGIVTAVSVASGASPVTSTVLGNFSVSTGLLDSTVAVVAGTEYLLGVSQNLVGVVSLKLGSNGVPTAQQSSVTLTGVAVNSKRLQGAAVYLSVASTSSGSSWGASALRVPALAAAVLVAAAVLAL